MRRQRLERLAGLDENRLVAGRGLKSAARSHRRRAIELDAAADATSLVGRDEGRTRAKERLDDVAAVDEIEKGADACVVHHNTNQLKSRRGQRGSRDELGPALCLSQLNARPVAAQGRLPG